jgi:hypothetical protein
MTKKFNERIARLLEMLLRHTEKHDELSQDVVKAFIIEAWGSVDRHRIDDVRAYLSGLGALKPKQDFLGGKRAAGFVLNKEVAVKLLEAKTQ